MPAFSQVPFPFLPAFVGPGPLPHSLQSLSTLHHLGRQARAHSPILQVGKLKPREEQWLTQNQSWNGRVIGLCPGHFRLSASLPAPLTPGGIGGVPGLDGPRLLGCLAGVAVGPPAPGGISAQGTGLPGRAPQAFLAIREGYKKQHFSAPECDLCDFTESREKQR